MTDQQVKVGDGLATVVATSNGQAVFTYDFLIYDATHLTVTKTPVSGGADVVLAYGVDYTVLTLSDEDGGNIQLETAAAAAIVIGDILRIERTIPISRLFDYQTSGDFKASVINRELDTLFMLLQDRKRASDDNAADFLRSVRLADGETFSTQLTKSAAAGKILGFDSLGELKYYQSFLAEIVDSIDVVTPEAYGAVGDASNDDTIPLQQAINAAISEGRPFIGSRKYRTTDTITIKTYDPTDVTLPEQAEIFFTGNSQIYCDFDNKRGVILQGRGIRLPFLYVNYKDRQPPANTAAIGVACRNVSFANIGTVRVDKSNIGFAQDYDWGSDNWFFSNFIATIFTYACSKRGLYIRPKNFGNTGNVINNVYANGRDISSSPTYTNAVSAGATTVGVNRTDYPVYLKGTSGTVINQLNIEEWQATGAGIYVEDCSNIAINGLHFEKFKLAADYANCVTLHHSSLQSSGISFYDVDTGDAEAISGGSLVGCFNTYTCHAEIDVIKLWGGHDEGAGVVAFSGVPGLSSIAVRQWDDESSTTRYVDADGFPTTALEGAGSDPYELICRHFNGKSIHERAGLKGNSGSTSTTTDTPINLPAIFDNCQMVDAATGKIEIPVAGRYLVSAQGKSGVGETVYDVIHYKASDMSTTYLTSSLADADQAYSRANMQMILPLAVGDQIYLQITSGETTLDASNWLTVERLD